MEEKTLLARGQTCKHRVGWRLKWGNLAKDGARKGGLFVALTLAGIWAAWAPLSANAADAAKPDRGYVYTHYEIPDKPWSIHVFRVDLCHTELEFHTTCGKSNQFGMSTVPEQLRQFPKDLGLPIAAVNGDFYDKSRRYPGRPRDLQIRDGELISSPSEHWAFYIDTQGKPQMAHVESRLRAIWSSGVSLPFALNIERENDQAVLYTQALGPSTQTRDGLELVLEAANTNSPWLPLAIGVALDARVREVRRSGNTPLLPGQMVLSLGPSLAAQIPTVKAGDTFQICTETVPSLKGVKTAIGGGPSLVRSGQITQWTGFQPRHPRTAVGWNKTNLFLVEVDGRQRRLSVGMTFPELAAYMAQLGCENALNLDGGGSSTMWVNGVVINSPSEGQERPAPNALVVVNKNLRRK